MVYSNMCRVFKFNQSTWWSTINCSDKHFVLRRRFISLFANPPIVSRRERIPRFKNRLPAAAVDNGLAVGEWKVRCTPPGCVFCQSIRHNHNVFHQHGCSWWFWLWLVTKFRAMFVECRCQSWWWCMVAGCWLVICLWPRALLQVPDLISMPHAWLK